MNIKGLLLIAGSGGYPLEVIRGARAAGVKKIIVAAFHGETDPELELMVDRLVWMQVGDLGALLKVARQALQEGVSHALMAGQIAPKNLFSLRPDWRAIMLLATLPERNAATLFDAVARQLEKQGITLLKATTFMEQSLATPGWIAGPKLKKAQLTDIEFGFRIAKEISRLNIGQTVLVKKGTVLAVEGFDGTDATIARGGSLAKGNAVMVKVSQPHQDLRFDVPVIGIKTLEVAAASGVAILAVEAGKSLLMASEQLCHQAQKLGVTLWGVVEKSS